MKKHIEITIQHVNAGKTLSPQAYEDWEFRMKALEIALRINPDLLDEFEDDNVPLVMY